MRRSWFSTEIRRQLFPHKADVVGEGDSGREMPARVIGVAEEKQSMFGSSKVLRVWLPYSTMSGPVMGQSWLNSITVRVKEGFDSAEAEQQLTRLIHCATVRRISLPGWTAS